MHPPGPALRQDPGERRSPRRAARTIGGTTPWKSSGAGAPQARHSFQRLRRREPGGDPGVGVTAAQLQARRLAAADHTERHPIELRQDFEVAVKAGVANPRLFLHHDSVAFGKTAVFERIVTAQGVNLVALTTDGLSEIVRNIGFVTDENDFHWLALTGWHGAPWPEHARRGSNPRPTD